MIKKYYAICLVKKEKYIDYKYLPFKCISNSHFYFKFTKNHLVIKLSYYINCLLLIQLNF